jgi:hypothetical protein
MNKLKYAEEYAFNEQDDDKNSYDRGRNHLNPHKKTATNWSPSKQVTTYKLFTQKECSLFYDVPSPLTTSYQPKDRQLLAQEYVQWLQ